MDKLKSNLLKLCIILIPFMSVITYFNIIEFNTSLADFILLFYIFVTFIDLKNFSLKRDFPQFWIFLILILWMIISNILSLHNPNINSNGPLGILNEGIKIGISSIYFYIGYHRVDPL